MIRKRINWYRKGVIAVAFVSFIAGFFSLLNSSKANEKSVKDEDEAISTLNTYNYDESMYYDESKYVTLNDDEKIIKDDDYLGDKILSFDFKEGNIEFESLGDKKISKDFSVYINSNKGVEKVDKEKLKVGMSGIETQMNDGGEISKLVLHKNMDYNNIRVLLRRNVNEPTKNEMLYYSEVCMNSPCDTTVEDKVGKQKVVVAKNKDFNVKCSGEKVWLEVEGKKLLESKNRLFAYNGGEITVKSLLRGNGEKFNPSYSGVLEFKRAVYSCFCIVNEVSIDDYVSKIVPSEIGVHFGVEALKAQAVISRTVAIKNYEGNRFCGFGAGLDDSTMSQVYNNAKGNEETNKAVLDTKGVIVVDDKGHPILSQFYGCSSGIGASSKDVWLGGANIPYLTSKSFTYEKGKNDILSTSNLTEEFLHSFFKDLSYKAIDSNATFFRWKVSFTHDELKNTMNKNLAIMYVKDKNSILTKDEGGNFKSMPIYGDALGTLKNIYVSKRGTGGNAIELIVEGSNGTYKILKEFNIRFIIRPRKEDTGFSDVALYLARGESKDYDKKLTRYNNSILPSSFFTIETQKSGNGIKSVTFYGGGNGHGVGVSQEGMRGLSKLGFDYKRIIGTYFDNISFKTIY